MRLIPTTMAFLMAAAPVMAQDDPLPMQMDMTPGFVRMFRTDEPVTDVIVGREDTADVTILSDHRIAITARQEGFTSIVFLGENRKMLASVAVLVHPAERLNRTTVSVRTGHKRAMEYHCDQPGGCSPSSKNVEKVAVVPLIINMTAPGVVTNGQ